MTIYAFYVIPFVEIMISSPALSNLWRVAPHAPLFTGEQSPWLHLAWSQGWTVRVCLPYEVLLGDHILSMAAQEIPVRVLQFKEDVAIPVLEQIQQDISASFNLEHVLLLDQLPDEALSVVRRYFSATSSRRVVVLAANQYAAWLKARLGPLAALRLGGPLRKLTSAFRSLSSVPEPLEKAAILCNYDDKRLKVSFKLGQLGTQAVETLLGHLLGRHNIQNVELDTAWQGKDVDFLARVPASSREIQVEVKTENYGSGNCSAEHYADFVRKTIGWLYWSEADIWVVVLWTTGEVILMDFKEAKDWTLRNKASLILTHGRAPEQPNPSQLYLLPIDRLMTELQDIVHLRLSDWLPGLYGELFGHRAPVIREIHQARKLSPLGLLA